MKKRNVKWVVRRNVIKYLKGLKREGNDKLLKSYLNSNFGRMSK